MHTTNSCYTNHKHNHIFIIKAVAEITQRMDNLEQSGIYQHLYNNSFKGYFIFIKEENYYVLLGFEKGLMCKHENKS